MARSRRDGQEKKPSTVARTRVGFTCWSVYWNGPVPGDSRTTRCSPAGTGNVRNGGAPDAAMPAVMPAVMPAPVPLTTVNTTCSAEQSATAVPVTAPPGAVPVGAAVGLAVGVAGCDVAGCDVAVGGAGEVVAGELVGGVVVGVVVAGRVVTGSGMAVGAPGDSPRGALLVAPGTGSAHAAGPTSRTPTATAPRTTEPRKTPTPASNPRTAGEGYRNRATSRRRAFLRVVGRVQVDRAALARRRPRDRGGLRQQRGQRRALQPAELAGRPAAVEHRHLELVGGQLPRLAVVGADRAKPADGQPERLGQRQVGPVAVLEHRHDRLTLPAEHHVLRLVEDRAVEQQPVEPVVRRGLPDLADAQLHLERLLLLGEDRVERLRVRVGERPAGDVPAVVGVAAHVGQPDPGHPQRLVLAVPADRREPDPVVDLADLVQRALRVLGDEQYALGVLEHDDRPAAHDVLPRVFRAVAHDLLGGGIERHRHGVIPPLRPGWRCARRRPPRPGARSRRRTPGWCPPRWRA